MEFNQIPVFKSNDEENDIIVLFQKIIQKLRDHNLLDVNLIDAIEYWFGIYGRNLRNKIAHGERILNLRLDDYYFLLYCLILIPPIIFEKGENNTINFRIPTYYFD